MYTQSPWARTSSGLDNLCKPEHSCSLAQVCSHSLQLTDKGWFEAWLLGAPAENWAETAPAHSVLSSPPCPD